ncbi:regulator of nonsense transcripts 3B [Ceratitis capitata]|uniref:regulator of nonsense transcripts 3B n=1 Tax=Ceratitis capitata TaxID=7213 RepID=UPI00032A10FD|nr:regulator of nonsense transcripts 3B [Ceratitis capitata]
MIKTENDVKVDIKSAKSEKERSNKRTHRKEKQKPQTKIVIRHLPPTMTEADFLKQIDPLPPHDFYYFAAADWSLGFDATCRAYISMKNYDDVFLFRDRFDGYVFVDSKGAEYPAIVEFAPFQGLKNKSRRVDSKVSTIEQESHYQNFITKLEEEREAAKSGECKLEFSLDRKKEEKITSTPLLQYLANKKEKRREDAKRRQEEKRRQRDEDKEKRKQVQVTKIISNNEGAAAGGGKSNKLGVGKENVVGEKSGSQQLHEEGKSSRSQRRAERNQKRREEFERKRQEREKVLEVKSKVDAIAGSERKTKEQSLQGCKADDGKQQQRKEGGKRYSERRERDRNRNRKEKEKEKPQSTGVDGIQKSESTASEAMKAAAVAAAGGEAIVSESVMNFIRSVATAKEFVPKHKQQKMEELKNTSSTESVAPAKVERDLDDKASEEEQKKENFFGEEDTRTQKQRNADEQRRIRNKDRPSIAIYQPKARLRISEERDPISSQPQGSVKSDTRSNPASDCESIKKEETRTKKVSRYSERRAERRNNKDKQKSSSDSADLEPKVEAAQSFKLDDIPGTSEPLQDNEK